MSGRLRASISLLALFIAAVAKPGVFSCSFGTMDSGHDGMRIDERQLDARFPPSVMGRAMCIAAGIPEPCRAVHCFDWADFAAT
jgi:hypothetical protein